jgi:HD-GYP domain-containing protein (c-di-GMP phosphodiesterase class II)
MPNLTALTNPRIDDPIALEEYKDDLADLAPKIEQDIARLKHAPDDRAIIANLFRAVHNIKGDAALCKVEMGVIIAHPIENLLGRLREGELEFSELLGEVVLVAVDRLELAAEALIAGRSVAHLRLAELARGLEDMNDVAPQQLNDAASRVIQAVTGFHPPMVKTATIEKKHAAPRADESQAADLRFFHSLAHRFEMRSPHFRGRTARITRLALETNQAAGRPVDPVQLQAAVYMHDVGMMFLAETVWLKVGQMSPDDKKTLALHPSFGAGLLERMNNWKAAAEIVLQHHEMPDGAGYPTGAKSDAICAGAKILAIVDAFEAVMLKHTHRGHSRSMLRAIAEINACDNQFAPEWVGPFNSVVRRMIET